MSNKQRRVENLMHDLANLISFAEMSLTVSEEKLHRLYKEIDVYKQMEEKDKKIIELKNELDQIREYLRVYAAKAESDAYNNELQAFRHGYYQGIEASGWTSQNNTDKRYPKGKR